jgi:hypothetical protein
MALRILTAPLAAFMYWKYGRGDIAGAGPST